jgi:hypothetical protein
MSLQTFLDEPGLSMNHNQILILPTGEHSPQHNQTILRPTPGTQLQHNQTAVRPLSFRTTANHNQTVRSSR